MKRLSIFLSVLATLLLFVAVSLPVSTRAQTVTPTATPTPSGTCTTPAQPTGVTLTYPSVVGTDVSYTQALCSWDAVSGAANYNVTFTNVDTNTVVQTQTVASTTTQLVFPVDQGKTYKCDVAAVNSCGTAGAVGTYSLLCQTNAILTTTVAPTVAPTLPPALPSTGNSGILYAAGIGSFALILLGGMLFFL